MPGIVASMILINVGVIKPIFYAGVIANAITTVITTEIVVAPKVIRFITVASNE